MTDLRKIVLVFVIVVCFVDARRYLNRESEQRRLKKVQLIQNLKKLKKREGTIQLVGGRNHFEGTVEILHNGQWGAICDDEWDKAEAMVVCRQLGFNSVGKHTHSSTFGLAKRRFWMDNVYCDGTEKGLTDCRFEGWGHHDCTPEEAAGVICKNAEEQKTQPENSIEIETLPERKIEKLRMPDNLQLRVIDGRVPEEGRVEIQISDSWHTICGDGWSLPEAMVVCRSLKLGYSSAAFQVVGTRSSFSGIQCRGNEASLSECWHDKDAFCPGNMVAAVQCVDKMADLVLDHFEIMRSAHLEDRQMFFLQCAMEENCLASQAYKIQQESDNWHLELRRLLKFTARSFNAGNDEFRPIIPKHLWEWHMCHMHYHSMEVFATFDIFDKTGKRVAEGHKASFCLEDNQCLPGIKPKYACANYGDQGISVNCSDIYKFTVDCQWVDISELNPGIYTFKVSVNPEFKIPEMSFENNAAVCIFDYQETGGRVYNCSTTRPGILDSDFRL